MSEYAISRKKLEEAQAIAPESILISRSTIIFNEVKKFKKGKGAGMFRVNDIAHVAFYDYKIPKTDPPDYCTKLIIVSLLLLFFPGYIKLMGILGFLMLFSILGGIEAKNAKRGKYGLFLLLNGGLEFVVVFKDESFLRQAIVVLYALRNSHPKLMDYLEHNDYLVLDLKDSKLINPIENQDVDFKTVVDPERLNHLAIIP
ncbi:MAG: hypothetical protein F6J87_29800 [Spirulina sp. SIO3F2]|nr:hypothetical protein [Spirulina sp. SIO3F2]